MNRILSIVTFVLIVPFIWGQDTVTDIDGNVYQTVQIGEQLWMKENLKVTHYNNGDEIPTGYSNSEWANLSTGAYAVYDDDPANADVYGKLYNWYAVETDNLAPEGWHVPTDDEWTILSDYLGGSDIAGGKLKECTEGSCPESEYWNSPNMGATNESGFTGLPGGCRWASSGSYLYLGVVGFFWSSTEYSNDDAWYRILNCNYSGIGRTIDYKGYGSSVRCVKDEPEVGTILVPYSSGWNIVGLPLEVEDASYSILFPESIEGTLYSFNGAYDPATNLINGEGYWLRFNETGSTTISGIPINELTISLNEGWNLLSGLHEEISVYSIVDPDNIIVPNTIYGYANGYSESEILAPGAGYWIKSIGDGIIHLSFDEQIEYYCSDEESCMLTQEYCEIFYPGVPGPDVEYSCEDIPEECFPNPDCECILSMIELGDSADCYLNDEGGFIISIYAP